MSAHGRDANGRSATARDVHDRFDSPGKISRHGTQAQRFLFFERRAEKIRASATPCEATGASILPVNTPRSFCRHKSRKRCGPVIFKSDQFAVTVVSVEPQHF
jgi:hypothetical protein